METSIRMIWIDSRVKSNPKPNSGVDFVSINGDQIHKFWVPDIFIDQAVKTRNPKVHVMPATLRVFPNGLIRSVVHISLFRSTTVVNCMVRNMIMTLAYKVLSKLFCSILFV